MTNQNQNSFVIMIACIVASAIVFPIIAKKLERFLPNSSQRQRHLLVSLLSCVLLIGYFAMFQENRKAVGYMFDKRPSPKVNVEWRTEITESAEPDSWPFKESRYMLGCLGALGDYSVYIVKLEDITHDPKRAPGFIPTYYGLKGSWFAWDSGEKQLKSGHSSSDFNRYIERSLGLCKDAEDRQKSGASNGGVELKK